MAINYIKDEKIHYRSTCDHCARVAKTGTAKWERAGYRKKLRCDRCGFSSPHHQQFDVFHIDGNLNNCRYNNLKTVCANCHRILRSLPINWKPGDLKPDL